MEDRVAPQGKKPYERPRLHRVRLAPEVAALGACKTGSQAGPYGDNCVAAACNNLVTS